MGQSDATHLEDAAEAYRDLLNELRREEAPHVWATAQTTLGTCSQRFRNGTQAQQYLVEAVVAFRSALEVRTSDHHPYEWAETQARLGGVLDETRGIGQ